MNEIDARADWDGMPGQGSRRWLVARLGAIALIVTAAVLASCSSSASRPIPTGDQQSASSWAQQNPQMWSWMQAHWDEVTLMHQHWGDVSWMREHLPDYAWMQGYWGDMVWMHDHWSGMTWMHSQGMMGSSPGGMMGQSGG